MKRLLFAIAALFAVSTFALPAMAAKVDITISRASQTMTVKVDGAVKYNWAVSTGKSLSWTRAGTFGVQSLSPNHRSSLYNWAPMPHSIFYDGNRAIHGTDHVSQLGSRASHGCVRLSRGHAATLYALVSNNRGNTRIVVR